MDFLNGFRQKYFLRLERGNGNSRKQNQYHSLIYMIKLQKKLS